MIFICYIVILPLHETSTYVGVVIIRYNNFAAVVYDGSDLFIETRLVFTIKSNIKEISKCYDFQNDSLTFHILVARTILILSIVQIPIFNMNLHILIDHNEECIIVNISCSGCFFQTYNYFHAS